MTREEAMSRTERHQPRHLIEPDQPGQRPRARWLGPAAVVGVLLLLLVPVVFVLVATRTTPVADTPSAAVSQPGRAGATRTAASAAAQPLLSDQCRQVLAAANRMIGHADEAVTGLRAHKQLMDDYRSGKIDRAKALPQDSAWRNALAFTLRQGVAAADKYDTDKATYHKLAAQCSKGG
jgi:hypothetical protein